ncbi:Plasmodium exported protein, unknown function [Plasmodium vivax]|uniref:Uncharacterized protein n=1 Tax=Plasmodium vivax TaxID=5855 RepID=A0A564ZQE6_PLAVI|nr:Plasmodium exported protein, unknown function [Plasmodium vivax]
MKNIKIIIFIKISAFILLTWSYSFITDVLFTKSLQKKYGLTERSNIRPFRLLTKSEILNETENYGLNEKLSGDVKDKSYKISKKNKSIYGQLKKQGFNDLDIYKKSFACKYSKKKGFTKLDCYCEKKIFDKLEEILLFAKNIKDDKKCFKKACKKYGLPFALSFIFAFTLGIIIVLDGCGVKCLLSATNKEDSFFYVGYSILFIILPLIAFLVFAYIAIKIEKYDRLVEGKVEGKKVAKKISSYYDDEFNSP